MTTDTPFWSDGRIWMDTAHRGARAEASGSRILPIFACASAAVVAQLRIPENGNCGAGWRGVGGASELQVTRYASVTTEDLARTDRTARRMAIPLPFFFLVLQVLAGTLAVCKQKLGFASFRKFVRCRDSGRGRPAGVSPSLFVVCPGDDPCEQQRVDFLCRRRLSFSVGRNAHHRGPLPANGAQPTAQLVSGRAHLRACPAGAHASRAVILPGARGAHSLPNE